ncbi:DNA-methyltransferase [Streptomyces nymphaeiformis]|uniref:Methyltransferase n=1 Tax=Streptomyces nymphaeiformis TaxID=2663842 RepID=A0A7W7U6B6_9ACTN|nr:site-specific DNA-methyltransferase [Streptomyces nymphaeiformis]MBB4984987.1 site-specific DNA-methyltransferase (adenine-specific) [Streptomyces nymphaeiformis]
MPEPYYADEHVTLYLGDSRAILPGLNLQADCVITDPPYGETALAWDQWPTDWPAPVAAASNSMWCFGSMRMFLEHGAELAAAGWKLSQDVIWEKANGSGFATDRFRRVHEIATHWYRGNWADIHHDTPRTAYSGPDKSARARGSRTPHTGTIGAHTYADNGTRLARSVIKAGAVRHQKRHPTEKPIEVLIPLIEYACPPGGLVLDPFAGSGSTLDAARLTGRRGIGIEANEQYAEAAANRLSALVLDIA